MKKIALTQGQYALVDDEDYDYLMQWRWYAKYSKGIKSSYVVSTTDKLSMHRVIMGDPKGLVIDHINHNAIDNQRNNLRNCTPAQNTCNRRTPSNNTSGYKGVYWERGQWRARIVVNRKPKHLGYFHCKHEAAKAYNTAAKMYHGQYALLNIIEKY